MAASIFFGFELCHAHIMYWNPQHGICQPLPTTAVVIHLQWMLDRNRVQSVYVCLRARPAHSNRNLMQSVFVEYFKLKKYEIAEHQTVAAFSGGTKILTVSQWAPAKANGVPSINGLRISQNTTQKWSMSSCCCQEMHHMYEDIESLTVWPQFAKVTTLCQPWLRG